MTYKSGNHTYEEIKSQGNVWEKIIQSNIKKVEPISKYLKNEHDEVIFSGCGSTHYLSMSAAKVWTSITNEFARGIPSSELWLYPNSTFSNLKSHYIAISRSGETTETIEALKKFKNKTDNNGVVISCYPDSTMVKESEFNLLAPEAQEKSVAQTRSFSSMFIITLLLAAHYAEDSHLLKKIINLPSIINNLIMRFEEDIKNIIDQNDYDQYIFLGSGIYYGLACEIMLKMKEMSLSISEAFNFHEFRHGPMSIITDKTLIVGLVSESRKKEELKVLSDMQKLGAKTLAIVDSANEVDSDYVFELSTGFPDTIRGVVYLPLGQLLSFYKSISKGLNPDLPKNLARVIII